MRAPPPSASTRTCLGLLLALALVAAAPTVAHAGGITDDIDFLHFRPFVGWEFAHVGEITTTTAGLPALRSRAFDANGLAWGAWLGFRIGLISVDALFQRSELGHTAESRPETLNKLYADVGFNFGRGWLRSVVDLGFGYSFLAVDTEPRLDGFGGRVGVSFDMFPTRWFSVGPAASFDLQGYNVGSSYVASVGGTLSARIGFHL